jgi:hypothetical protein
MVGLESLTVSVVAGLVAAGIFLGEQVPQTSGAYNSLAHSSVSLSHADCPDTRWRVEE